MEKIIFFEIEPWEEEYIRRHSFLSEENLFIREKLDEKNLDLANKASIISTFIYSNLNQSILEKIPNLKFITTRSTGFDHIDLSYCQKRGILVSNVPTYGQHSVAEHTFALILALSRKLIPSVEQSRRGNFSLENLRGFELFKKTLGVLGAGKIGKRVIELGLAFGMKVLVFTHHPDSSEAYENVSYVSLDSLLENSDIVSLHLPSNPQTRHIINRESIKKFKKGSILINTARGELVETQALLEGLEAGILKGVGLDVLEEECSLKEERQLLTSDFLKTCDIKTQLLNHVLITRENVIITPHNAFNSEESLLQILETTIGNINSYITGEPQNVVS